MFLKVVYQSEEQEHQHDGFTIYECERVQVLPGSICMEGRYGSIELDNAAHLRFFVMNDLGKTIDQFRGGWPKPLAAGGGETYGSAT